MARMALTERFITSPKRVPSSGRADYLDSIVPGLAVRVTAQGHRSFVLIARYPSSPRNPTRRALGVHGQLTLDQAREKARTWLEMIGRGVDPKIEAERERAANLRRQVNTFGAVAEAFLERHAAGLAKQADARRTLLVDFGPLWRDRPINDIRPEEIARAVRTIVERGAPYQAHNALGYLRRMFTWAIGTHQFGVTISPVERLKPRDLIGVRAPRERILSDEELRSVWSGAGEMGYPYGPLVRLLILTGQRVREVADMTWPEFAPATGLWTVPAGRMKGGRAHEVPLGPAAIGLLADLPRFNAGSFVFTTTSGAKAVNGFSKAKDRIDALSGVSGWKLHDLRRTMRTRLSALPVQDLVRELVIAHAKPGLHRVYDQHAYQAEKREALELWERRLRAIIE